MSEQKNNKPNSTTNLKPESAKKDNFHESDYTAGKIVKRPITDEMKSNYLDYSMSVIVARALPDVRDGLKPSQRRILVAMNDLGLKPTAHFRKSAKIAGDTSGNYHPHGETVVYPTMVKMAQEFSTRYQLVLGQGNFGSIDGDKPAAMRYTEAKMQKITMQLLGSLGNSTVIYTPNYDGTRDEPTVLPSRTPNLLCNGSDGIAVGMATKIPPHNLGEIVDALIQMIELSNKWKGNAIYNELRLAKEQKERTPKVLNPKPHDIFENYIPHDILNRQKEIDKTKKQLQQDNSTVLYPQFESSISVEQLMEHIPGPDFPTGGIIYDKKEIEKAYATGRGRILIRAKSKIEEGKNERFQIIITEVPYQTNKAHMIEKIANLVKDKKIEGIADIRDESNREGIRVVIVLKKKITPKVVLNKLFKYTELQKAFNTNMISLVDGEPKTLNLKNMLELFLTHRIQIVIRRVEFQLAQSRYRNHILEGLLKALDLLDEVIKTIRGSKTQKEAKINLIKKFKFTEAQAVAILDMPLGKLAAMERQKLKDEHKEVTKQIKHFVEILSKDSNVLKVVKKELTELKEKFGDTRRTKVIKGRVDEISTEDIIKKEDTLVTISHEGYIKRVSPEIYRTQRRGGKGVVGAPTKEKDYIEHAVLCNTHSTLLLFTNLGKVYELKAWSIPEYKRQAKGLPIVNLLSVEQTERITSIVARNGESSSSKKSEYLLMVTQNGIVKKSKIANYENIRKSGLIAINLDKEDELGWVLSLAPKDNVILVTQKGKCIRFSEKDVRPTGRSTRGVLAIRFKKEDDRVISTNLISSEKERLFVISQKGYGKSTKLSKYSAQKRGGSGVFTFRTNKKTGLLVTARIITQETDEMVVVSKNGIVIKVPFKNIPTLGRHTSGVRIMNLKGSDSVSAIAIV